MRRGGANRRGVRGFGGASASPAAWTPADEAGAADQELLLIDDPDTITVVSSAVSAWTDQSGNAKTCVQTIAGSRPTLLTIGTNARTAVASEASGKALRSGANTLPAFTDITAVVVFANLGTAGIYERVIDRDATGGWGIWRDSTNADAWSAGIDDVPTAGTFNAGAGTEGDPLIFVSRYNATTGTHDLFANSTTATATRARGAAVSMDAGEYVLFGTGSGNATLKIGYIDVRSAAMSDSDVAALVTNLGEYFGITVS